MNRRRDVSVGMPGRGSCSSSSTHTFATAILFWVSVPVLSVQITVTEPRVSTEVSVFISAFRFAMRWLPMASASVTVGSKPSGMSATVMPIAENEVVPEASADDEAEDEEEDAHRLPR